MTFDLQRILESKRALRRSLAQRPVAEKLALLDALRDRVRAIRTAATARDMDTKERTRYRRLRERLRSAFLITEGVYGLLRGPYGREYRRQHKLAVEVVTRVG